MRRAKAGVAAAQEGAKEGAKWERWQHKRAQKREQNGSGGSPRGRTSGSGVRISGLFPTSPTSFGVCVDLRDSSGKPRTFLHATCGRPQPPS
jgi:hypothetical protein